MKVKNRLFVSPLLCLIVIAVTGCAGSPGSVNSLAAPPANSLQKYTKLSLEVKKKDDVVMLKADQDRIAELIVQTIKAKTPNRFSEINPPASDANTMHAVINFTRYEEGSSLARLLLAGIGQMHIDADVVLEHRLIPTTLAKYEVTKTFAWGGIYGVMTKIGDLEKGFAEAAAAAIGGEGEEKADKTTEEKEAKR